VSSGVVLDVPVASYTIDDIEAVAGARSYQRGIDYIDRVSDLAAGAGVVTAVVYGSGAYQVRLEVDAGLDGDCDCPWGQEGNFCKHCVAVALVYLYQVEHGIAIPEAAADQPPALVDYLATLEHDQLVELLLEAAGGDPGLRRRLELRAAADHASDQDDVSGLRRSGLPAAAARVPRLWPGVGPRRRGGAGHRQVTRPAQRRAQPTGGRAGLAVTRLGNEAVLRR
jgi:uncharacterized Zn finger protein